MKNTTFKTKMFILLAVAIVAIFLIVNVALLININIKQHQINQQQKEIEQLKDKVASQARVKYTFANCEVEL